MAGHTPRPGLQPLVVRSVFLGSMGIAVPRLILGAALILAVFASPFAVEAQRARIYRIGVILEGSPYHAAIDGLRDGLSEFGLQEGKQFVLHMRDAKGGLKSVEGLAIPRSVLARADQAIE